MDNYDVVDFNSLSETVQSLIKAAVSIRHRAYVPYSNFAVGAAILTEEDSKVYTGCNIENAALSPTICAERSAVPKAVCDGYLKFKVVAVVAHQETSFTAPCGVCRQTLSEFCGSDGDMDIYLSRPMMDKVLCTKLSRLLPLSFVSYKEDSVVTCYRVPIRMDNFQIVDFNSLDETVQNLIKQANEIRKMAYCPYSNFAVGSAILTEEDNRVYTGCNIENAAYSPIICAKRSAIPKAVCDGYLRIKTAVVVAEHTEFTAPCGVCRQTLSEFRSSDGDMDVYLSKPSMDQVLRTKLSKLLPLSFRLNKNDTHKVTEV